MAPIKNIVFDFGGVLIDWNPRHLYRNVFNDNAEMENFLKNICTSEWNAKQDAGRSFTEATEELVQLHPEYEPEIRRYYDNWPEMISGEIAENAALINPLKTKYKLFGLTNWSAESFPIIYKQYPFLHNLEGIVVSGTEKLIKPDRRIFELLLNRFQIKSSESLFIDDSLINIETADKLGFHTIHLPEGTNLRHELEKRDILKLHPIG
jgi:2-haloacid dehalogenase